MDNKDNKNINKDRYTKSKIYFEEGENYNLPKESKVQVVDCGNKIIIKHSWRNSNNLKKYIRKDKDHYIDIDTGELLEYSRKSQYKTKKEIVKAMKYLRELIQANFKGNFNELFITVTCRNEVTDIRKIKRYAKYFIKKLKKKYPEKQFEYIYKFERQENQNWHIHFLIKDIKNKQLYIPNENIETIWNRGFTKTQRVYDGSSTEERLLTQEDEELLSEEDATTNEALKSIKVTTQPTKKSYTEGDKFDPTGMVIMAEYSDGTTKTITGYTVTNGGKLVSGQTSVTISYKDGDVTKETTQAITVSEYKSGTSTGTGTNTGNQTPSVTKTTDDSASSKEIPKTGLASIVFPAIVLGIIAGISYIAYKKSNV